MVMLMAVRVAVAIGVRVAAFRCGHGASIVRGALDVLELDGRVMDMEARAQTVIHGLQNRLAGRRWNVIDGDVAAERVHL